MIRFLKFIHRSLINAEPLLDPYGFHAEPVRRLNVVVYPVTDHDRIFGQAVRTSQRPRENLAVRLCNALLGGSGDKLYGTS